MPTPPSDRWQQLDELLAEALTRTSDQRLAFLQDACGEDAALLAELQDLLSDLDEAADAIGDSVTGFGVPLPDVEPDYPLPADTHIGPYRIIKRLGRGGMGSVYLAAREDFKKYVAVKVVRRGMDTEDILRRFRSERQIMASLDHPHIARLLDGGMTNDGRPYFVMEHVDGIPIDTYCDRHKLSVSERLALFRQVCDAVQYAHQHLVVHRDLKPSNILVVSPGSGTRTAARIKLLDFGIAKVLNPQLVAATVAFTRTEIRLMTPAYASPEQVRGDQVTTASDVYALGVLLYELLTGHRPYQVKNRVQKEVMRVILEEDPTRPSTMVSESVTTEREDGTTETITPANVSAARGTEPARLKRTLSGDLDNIVLKAMRKEPARRYASVEQLGEDVRRHLDGLPILARPATIRYRVRKFVQRHKLGVGVATLVVALLITVAALAVGFAVQTARQAAQIALERDKAEEVTEFLVDLFEVNNPSEALGDTLTAREVLDKGADRIREELADQPALRGRLLDVLGRVYYEMGVLTKAEPLLEEALAVRRDHFGQKHLEVVESLRHLGWVREDQDATDEALALHREALDIHTELLGPDYLDVTESKEDMARMLRTTGAYAESEMLFKEVLSTRRDALGDDHLDLASTLNNLGTLYWVMDRYDEGEAVYRESLAIRRKQWGDKHPLVVTTMNNLGLLLHDKGDYPEALIVLKEALDLRRELLGNEHPLVATSLNNLGLVHYSQKSNAEAEVYFEEALALRRRLFGDDHSLVALGFHNLASVRYRQGNIDEAEALFRRAAALYRARNGATHTSQAGSLRRIGLIQLERQQYREAEAQFRAIIRLYTNAYPDGHWRAERSRIDLAEALIGQERPAEAEPLLKAAYTYFEQERGPDHALTMQAKATLEKLEIR